MGGIDSDSEAAEGHMRRTTCLAGAVVLLCSSLVVQAQYDPVRRGADALHEASGGKLSLHLEERTRWEEKFGVTFGKDVNQQDMLSRLRIGMDYKPSSWVTISGMGQDARAPFFGKPAPNSLRDMIDLHEAYVDFGSKSSPIDFSFGRRMLNYGETRVIGVPQWSNVARTYDFGRLEYSNKRMTLDALMISPVIVKTDSFNKPELGNRFWGTYDVFPGVWRGSSMDVYALRHSQNKIGGWTGKGTLGTNSFGARLYGPLPGKFAYSLEGIGQTGHAGLVDQRAYAWFAGMTKSVKVGRLPIDLSAEFKEASGSRAGSSHSATFDQMTPANHDKFGHQDLFGWRNLETFKTLETAKLTKALALNLMYTNESLFSASDSVYSSSGGKIATDAKGKSGRHVGQELDAFLTVRAGRNTFYAGFGHFFKGEFIDKTTSGINPRYFYIAQQYVLK